MKIKTADLIGPPLDWAVAACYYPEWDSERCAMNILDAEDGEGSFSPSVNWLQGGPIIEQEGICVLRYSGEFEVVRGREWAAVSYCGDSALDAIEGPTPLVAAMRCYVTYSMGDEVDIPDGLVTA